MSASIAAALLAALTLQQAHEPLLATGTRAELHAVREVRKKLIAPATPNTHWTHFDPACLTVTLDLVGPEMIDAYRYGRVQVDARDNLGNALQTLRTGTAGSHPIDSFQDIDPEFMFAWENPKPTDRLRIDLGFGPPPREATHLASIEGSITVQRADAREILTFDRITERCDETLSHPLLDGAGVTIHVQERGQGALGTGDADKRIHLVITGPMEVLSDIELTHPDGQALNAGRTWSREGTRTLFTLQVWETLATNTALRLNVAIGQQTVRVPFKFQNVALP